MDTPERNSISAPSISKFEDSPVFNYINSLSPIPSGRSTHIAQSFNSLSFASLPSVFTSPHVSSHKESRFLRRHQNAESSEKNGENLCSSEGVRVIDSSQVCNSQVHPQENLDIEISTKEGVFEPPSGHSKSAIEHPQTLKYDSGIPSINPTTGIQINGLHELADPSASLVQMSPEKHFSRAEASEQGICHTEQETAGMTYEWESLMSDATDLFIFNSPENAEAFKELMQKSVDRGRRFIVSQYQLNDTNDVQTTLLVDSEGSIEQYVADGPSHHGEAHEIQTESSSANTSLKQFMPGHPNDKTDDELGSNLHRGMRRRCLDFEMASAHRKSLGGGLLCKSSILSQFDEKIAFNDQSVAKRSADSLRRILPGIGLHLNALATTSVDYKSLKCETSSSERQIISLSSSVATFDSPTAIQEPVPELLSSSTAERDKDAAEDEVQIMEDASGVSSYLLSEEFDRNSPKKKRCKLEQETESEGSCKRCNCKKSKCLKLYCECFAAGVYCIEPCSCQDCFNKPIHEDTVLATRKQIESRNPLAFAPKVIRSSDTVPEIGDDSSKTPASARHKRGCNCKKSSCLKKYCECFQGGVGCSINCRCEGCKNTFGRKDGCNLFGPEVEQEHDVSEISISEKSAMSGKGLQKTEIQSNKENNSTSTVPKTPHHLYRPLIQIPSSSMSKPPRCSFPAIGSTSGSLLSSQKFGRPSIFRTEATIDKQCQTRREEEMPDILQEKGSPNRSGVKMGSPNSKRVSPPHCNFGSSSSPGKRSGRKLILQSIPSFPSLTPHH